MEVKNRKGQINKLLHELARSDATEAKWVRELFVLQAEDAKERLVNAEASEFLSIQGEAKVMERINRQLTAASTMPGSQ